MNEVQAAALQVNDSAAAILQHVPINLHKFLTGRQKNQTTGEQESRIDFTTATKTFFISADAQNGTRSERPGVPSIEEIKRQITRYNDQQSILNEETFGPLLNDSVIIVVQVSSSRVLALESHTRESPGCCT